jgi:hypothetical protein
MDDAATGWDPSDDDIQKTSDAEPEDRDEEDSGGRRDHRCPAGCA